MFGVDAQDKIKQNPVVKIFMVWAKKPVLKFPQAFQRHANLFSSTQRARLMANHLVFVQGKS